MAVLTVNGVPISREQIGLEAGRLRRALEETGREVTPEESMGLREEAELTLIDRVLLSQEASRLALYATPEEIARGLAGCRTEANMPKLRDEVARRIAIDKLFDRWSQNTARFSRRQVRSVYETNRDQFWFEEAIQVCQIVRNVHHPGERDAAREVLRGVLDALDAHADFARLAEVWSDCPEDGGTLGYITRGQMVPEFEEVVFALKLNQHSPIFQTRFGYHIALVTAKRSAGPLSFADAAPLIENDLRRASIEKEVGKRLEQLRSAASIARLRG